jgi:hypothetical protein
MLLAQPGILGFESPVLNERYFLSSRCHRPEFLGLSAFSTVGLIFSQAHLLEKASLFSVTINLWRAQFENLDEQLQAERSYLQFR